MPTSDNGVETCDGMGGCEPGVPPDCDDGDLCTDDTCETLVGCTYTNNTAACDDGDPCTVNDSCSGGACQPGPPRDCDDGDICNGTETCDPAVGCVAGTDPLDCSDDDDCTEDLCDPVLGCTDHVCGGQGRRPYELPKANDRTFVTKLDQSAGAGSIVDVTIPVTRYAGPTDSATNTLLYATDLVDNNVAGQYAELGIIASGVDCWATSSCDAHHYVSFNGVQLDQLPSEPADPNSKPITKYPYLQGLGCEWFSSRYSIPLEYVRFPGERGNLGESPLPMDNTVRIEVDADATCFTIHGAYLRVKLMSPIILIHGTNSDGDFWDRQTFTAGLAASGLLYDNSISMDTDTVEANGRILHRHDARPDIPEIVASFGVDSVHFVAHSKGGLDAREYLAAWQPAHDGDFKVLSLTTLSTPHNGSVLADMVQEGIQQVLRQANIIWHNVTPVFDSLATISSIKGSLFWDEGQPDLTLGSTADFNSNNIPYLPRSVVYNAVASDADKNGSLTIDTPFEFSGFLWESDALAALTALNPVKVSALVDELYQVLHKVPRIRVIELADAAIIAAPVTPSALGNDILVTIPSALGEGSYSSLTGVSPIGSSTAVLTGAAGRDHAAVADGITAGNVVAPWLITIETIKGDLR